MYCRVLLLGRILVLVWGCRTHGTWLALSMLVTMKVDGDTRGWGLLYVLYY